MRTEQSSILRPEFGLPVRNNPAISQTLQQQTLTKAATLEQSKAPSSDGVRTSSPQQPRNLPDSSTANTHKSSHHGAEQSSILRRSSDFQSATNPQSPRLFSIKYAQKQPPWSGAKLHPPTEFGLPVRNKPANTQALQQQKHTKAATMERSKAPSSDGVWTSSPQQPRQHPGSSAANTQKSSHHETGQSSVLRQNP